MPEKSAGILIRPAVEADIRELAQLFDDYRVFYKYPTDLIGSRVYIGAEIASGATRFFVASQSAGDSVLGFVHLIPSCNTTAFKPIWYLEDLFVRPSARRQGVGEALMLEAERFARATGAERLTLATAHDNHAAQTLYRKMGYVREDHFWYFHRMLTPAVPAPPDKPR